MPVVTSQSDLENGVLRLFLTNDLGYRTDPFSVRWTVYDSNGNRVSGNKLTASRSGVGDYYAPWRVCSGTGCHEIVWEYQNYPGDEVQYARQGFFVKSSSCFCCSSPGCESKSSGSCSAFYIGSTLGRGDLSLYLKDGDGIPFDAYSVTWQIYNSTGCAISPVADAVQVTVGEYFANWFVNISSGEYTIKWKVIEEAGSPAQSFSQSLSILCSSTSVSYSPEYSYCESVDPCPPYQIINPSDGNCHMALNCDFEIPRVIHLSSQNLPVGGAFTNQAQYIIPSRIRLVTFYIKYRRSAPGGYASFKLLWGNGTEEAQSTLINGNFANNGQDSQQNMYMNVYNGPAPLTDDFITFSIETIVPGGSKTVRLLSSEVGLPMNPGIVEITLTASTQ